MASNVTAGEVRLAIETAQKRADDRLLQGVATAVRQDLEVLAKLRGRRAADLVLEAIGALVASAIVEDPQARRELAEAAERAAKERARAIPR